MPTCASAPDPRRCSRRRSESPLVFCHDNQTSLPPDFNISSDGSEVVLERTLKSSDVVKLDLPRAKVSERISKWFAKSFSKTETFDNVFVKDE